jgi:hypothetical protein
MEGPDPWKILQPALFNQFLDAVDVTRTHGFLRNSDGTYVTIDAPVAQPPGIASQTYANGINNSGWIVGQFYDGTFHGLGLAVHARTLRGARSGAGCRVLPR